MPYLPGMDKPKFTPLKPNATFTDDLKSFNISLFREGFKLEKVRSGQDKD